MKIEEEVKILRKAYQLLAESYHKQMCSECECATCAKSYHKQMRSECATCTVCFYRKEKLEQLFIERAKVAIDEAYIAEQQLSGGEQNGDRTLSEKPVSKT